MAHSVFISYSTKDTPLAESICQYLEAAGISCWIAPRDIQDGAQDWEDPVVKALKSAKAFLIVFTEDSNKSSQVMREVRIAFEEELPVVLFRTTKVIPTDKLDFYLKGTQWFNAFSPQVEDDFPRLLKAVTNALSEHEEIGSVSEEQRSAWRQKRIVRRRNRVLLTLAFAILAITATFKAIPTSQPPEIHPTLPQLRAREAEIEGSLAKTLADEKAASSPNSLKATESKAAIKERQQRLLDDLGKLILESQREGHEPYATLWSARHLVLCAQFGTGGLTLNQAISQATGKLRVAWQLSADPKDKVLELGIQQSARTVLSISKNAQEPQPPQIQQEIDETLTAIVRGKR